MQSAVDRAKEHRDFRFCRSSATTYRWAKAMDPRLFRAIRRLVRKGRWEIVGGWVEQADCNLPSAESFLRQALYAKAFFTKEFGETCEIRTGYNVDSFGHSGGLPQLLRQAGFDSYVFMRPDPYDNPAYPLLFWWEGADGSRVLTQRIPGCYAQSYGATDDDLEQAVRTAATANFSPGFRNGAMWFGVGNHGGGPTRAHLARIRQLQKDMSLPEIRFSTLAEYFAAVRGEPAFADLPTVRAELQFNNRGCYAANGETKRLHRRAEKALWTAESLQAMSGQADPRELREAWWRLLLNEFHDILAGTCVAEAEEEIRSRFGAVLTEANECADRRLALMARRVDTRREPGSVLFAANPLPWARTALVQLDTFMTPHNRVEITHLETADGTAIPLQWQHPDANFGPWGLPWGKLTAAVPLPAGGYRVFRVATRPLAGPPPPTVPPAPSMPPPAQALDSFRAGAGELLAGPLGLVVIRDTGSTWGHGVTAYGEEVGRPEPVSVGVLADGPVVSVIRQKWRWQASEIWLDAIRHPHAPAAVELRFRINWQERRQLLKLELPTRLGDVAVHARMPGEVVHRQPGGNEEPCQDWVALDGRVDGCEATLALIHQSSHSYAVAEGVLRQILVRGVPHAEHPPFGYSDDANVAFLDQGWQERRFLLVGGEGAWQQLHLDRRAAEFLVPAATMLDSGHPGREPWERSALAVGPESIAVLAVKPAEDGKGTILRLQETAGRASEARGQWQGHAFAVPLGPWQVKTMRLAIADGVLTATETDALER